MMKALSAAIVLAVISLPLAQASSTHGRAPSLKDFRGVYNELGAPSTQSRGIIDNPRFDPSRLGDLDPTFNPPGT
jgi:hypothetical protein